MSAADGRRHRKPNTRHFEKIMITAAWLMASPALLVAAAVLFMPALIVFMMVVMIREFD